MSHSKKTVVLNLQKQGTWPFYLQKSALFLKEHYHFFFYILFSICENYTGATWSILKLVIVQSGKQAGPYFLENVADNSMDMGGFKSSLMAQ